VNVVIPLVKPKIRSQAVLDTVAGLPRHHLGQEYYQSDLRPGKRISHRRLAATKRNLTQDRGFASTPKPLPRFEGQENCLFTIIVPRVYLNEISREEITRRKAVWGTDIYTDDSDIIAACIHQGWFRGAWNEDVDVSLLDLEIGVESSGEVKRPFNIDDIMTSPPPTGPIVVPEDRDCHITVVILPLLESYGSTTRFGLKSREWGFKRENYQSIHDGLSFMIHSVRWVGGVDGQQGRTRASRSKIFAKQLEDRELEEERLWDDCFRNGGSKSNALVQESYERGGPRQGDIHDTKSWITGINKPSSNEREQEPEQSPTPPPPPPPPVRILGPLPPPIPSPLSSPIIAPEPLEDEEVTANMAALLASSLEAARAPTKEAEPSREPPMPTPQQETQIERVTERMIENANMTDAKHASVPPPATAVAMDPIAALADAASMAPIIPATARAGALVPDKEIKQEGGNDEVTTKPPKAGASEQVPSIFG
jgi:hypothetical protein